jgi:hypothetical protein
VGYPSGFILLHNILSTCIDPGGTFINVAGGYFIYKINYLAKKVVAQWDFPYGSVPYDTRIKPEVADNGPGMELYVCFSLSPSGNFFLTGTGRTEKANGESCKPHACSPFCRITC